MADKPEENKDKKPDLKVPPATADERRETADLHLQMDMERAEHERDRKAAGLEAKKDRVAKKGELERDDLKNRENLPAKAADAKVDEDKSKAPVKVVMNLDLPIQGEFSEAEKNDFIKQVDDGSVGQSLNKLALNIYREDTKINSQQWHEKATNLDGLKEVYNDFYKLGIIDNNPEFYKKMFAILENGANPENPYRNDRPEYKVLFLDPINHVREISALPPKPGFVGGELYAKAFEQFHAIQAVVSNQDKMQLATADKQEKQDKDSLANGAVDFLKDNVNTFRKAIREKDYATAGMYAVGIWAIYKSYQKLTEGKDGLKTKLMYAAAAYCGYEFAKNAGYDILKMAGVKDADYDVKGTPMEIMQRILSKNSKLKEDTKDLDFDTVLRMADVNLKSLDDLYKKNNDPDIHFIDPAEFPGLFPPEVLRARPTNLGLSSNLKDGDGMNGIKFGPDEKKYIHLGQQIYKMAIAMRGIYDETLKKDEKQKDFFGIPYEDALKSGNHSLGKVRHLMGALDKYADRSPSESFLGKKHLEKVREDMSEAFKGKPDIGLWIRDKVAEGHFEGRIMGMPVIFVMSEDGKSYKAYLKNRYGGAVPGPGFMAEIPVEAGAARDLAVDKVETNVKARMAELLGNIAASGGRYSAPRYERGEWVADVTYDGADGFDIDARPAQVSIVVNSDGKGINLVGADGVVRININEEVNRQYPLSLPLALKITAQPGFEALKIFARAGEFKVREADKSTGVVKVLLGKKNLPIEFTYDKTSKTFSIDAAKEEALVKDPSFASSMVECLNDDEGFELNKNLKELKDLIGDSCSEGFIAYFFNSLVGSGRDDQLSGVNADVISGSVPENFTNMIIDTSKTEVMERFRYGIMKASKLSDIEPHRQNVLQDFNTRMKQIIDKLKASNAELRTKGDKWDRDRFMSEVVGRVRAASSVSKAYTKSRMDFEFMVYSLDLPGLFVEKSDLSNESHAAASKLMGVFAYYTAHLDNPTLKYGGVDKRIDLDNLTYPPVPTAGITNNKVDPAFEGHYINRYLGYVQQQVISRAQSVGNLTNLPDGSAAGFWGIKPYERWKMEDGTPEPLNSADNSPPFTHDVSKHAGRVATNGAPAVAPEHTELDNELKRELEKAADLLRDEYGDDLNYTALRDYLFKADNGSIDLAEIGLCEMYMDENDVVKSKLWEITERINRDSHGKRSEQIKLIENEVEKLMRKVFEEKSGGDLKFFKKKPGWRTRLVMAYPWPWLRDLLM